MQGSVAKVPRGAQGKSIYYNSVGFSIHFPLLPESFEPVLLSVGGGHYWHLGEG